MVHIKNDSFGYSSTLLRYFPSTTFQITDDISITVYPHDDDPTTKHVGNFDLEVNGSVTKSFSNLTYQALIDHITIFATLA